MSLANEYQLLAELRTRQAEVVSDLADRMLRMEEREREHARQWEFFRGKQVAIAGVSATAMVGVLEIAKQVVIHFLK